MWENGIFQKRDFYEFSSSRSQKDVKPGLCSFQSKLLEALCAEKTSIHNKINYSYELLILKLNYLVSRSSWGDKIVIKLFVFFLFRETKWFFRESWINKSN